MQVRLIQAPFSKGIANIIVISLHLSSGSRSFPNNCVPKPDFGNERGPDFGNERGPDFGNELGPEFGNERYNHLTRSEDRIRPVFSPEESAMKIWSILCVCALVGALFLVVQPVFAEDGFTQKDRELLLRLALKMEEIDRRFEQVDKRFDQMDKRFDQVNKRFEQVDKRIEELRADMNIRFVETGIRTEELRADMNARFEMFNQRFGDIMTYFWVLAAIFTALTVATLGFGYWDRRTAIRKAREETIAVIEKEGRLSILIKALREYAQKDDKLAHVLRSFGLL